MPKPISTRNIIALPDMESLRRNLMSMSMLDAILCREWEFRYYSFNSAWAPDEQMGSMRDGCGDHFFAHFGPHGCWLKGFAHDYPTSPYQSTPNQVWPGVLDAVPDDFEDCLREPAFMVDDATFCIWRRKQDASWQIGPVLFPANHPDPDGSESLLSLLDGRPETYQGWAQDYYECDVSLDAVRHIYQHLPLTHEVVAQLDPAVSLAGLEEDVNEIGYPDMQQVERPPIIPG